METKELDKAVISFIEENSFAIIVTFIVISAVQFIWWLQRAPSHLLSKEGFHSLPLVRKEHVNHNTLYLSFGFENKRQKLGLPVGQHLVFRWAPKGEDPVSRPYTPVSDGSTQGHVDFIIKIYPEGVMTQYLNKLEVGQRLMMKGPKGKFKYKPNMKKSIGMLAGGSGITPMYQVLIHILKNPKDKTHVSLIYANVTPADILLRQDLDALSVKYATQFDVYYVIEKNVPTGWKYGVGYITQKMIEDHCPPPSQDSMLLWCGPPPMVDAMAKLSEKIGYAPDCTFKF